MLCRLVFLFLLFPFLLFSQEKTTGEVEEIYFLKIKNFFTHLFPQSFVAEIKSSGITEDIRKIPSIYIKNQDEKPALIVFFSQKMGIKVQMTNVAKGISKQYNEVSSSFKSFYPFIQNDSYKEFQKKFFLFPINNKTMIMQEIRNSKDIYYTIEIDSLGKILSIEQISDKKPVGKVIFTYKKEQGIYIINTLKVLQRKPDKSYIFFFTNYDLAPDLRKEDFLG